MNTAPLRASLLAAAERDAAALVAAAASRADDILATARAAAEAEVAAAARSAREEAEARRARALAAARGEARACVVLARGEAVDSALAAARAAATALRGTSGYERFLEGLAGRARRELGPDAVVDRDPPGGGIVARRGRDLLDLSIPALLALAVREHGDELEALWQ